jgi:hypothetical protein
VEEFTRPAHIPSRHWVLPIEYGGGEMLEMQLLATKMRLLI